MAVQWLRRLCTVSCSLIKAARLPPGVGDNHDKPQFKWMALNEEWGRRSQYFYIKSVFFLSLCVVRISVFICFDTLSTRAGKIRLICTNRKTRDKYFEKPKERRSKTQNDSHLHMHMKQKHITWTRAWLTINKLGKHVYFFPMTDCAIETDNVGMVELAPDIQLLVLIV